MVTYSRFMPLHTYLHSLNGILNQLAERGNFGVGIFAHDLLGGERLLRQRTAVTGAQSERLAVDVTAAWWRP